VGHGLGEDRESVGKNVLLNVARFRGHFVIFAHGRGNCHSVQVEQQEGAMGLTALHVSSNLPLAG